MTAPLTDPIRAADLQSGRSSLAAGVGRILPKRTPGRWGPGAEHREL